MRTLELFALATAMVVLSIQLLAAAPAAAEKRHCLGGVCKETCVRDICIYVSANESFGVIDASNDSNMPIGVHIQFDRLVNVESYPPPYGDPTARHRATARYRLPFGGKQKRVLTQGQNGRFTHKGVSAYSYDFGMPIGTPILAARPGRVVEVHDGHTKSGVSPEFLDKANAVTILHTDGTFATYAHLDPGAGVRPGMLVNVGEVIGNSGNTGFSTGPHLHFSVWKATMQGGTTVPILFHSSRQRQGFTPREGVAYAPTCHREGVPCAPGEVPARPASWGPPPLERSKDGTCRCKNGSVITVDLPCRMVCPQ